MWSNFLYLLQAESLIMLWDWSENLIVMEILLSFDIFATMLPVG